VGDGSSEASTLVAMKSSNIEISMRDIDYHKEVSVVVTNLSGSAR
jgi:hypothetical protein